MQRFFILLCWIILVETRDHIKMVDEIEQDFKSIDSMKNVSVIEGCLWNHIDKNRGLLLLEASDVLKAEREMMTKMEAVLVCKEPEEILEELREKERLLRCGFGKEQKKYMKDFKLMRKDKAKFPFMKIQAKIHKLSKEQIENKDVQALKFRPVNDSKFFVTKPAATALLGILRDVNVNVVKRFKNLSGIFPKSGWEVAQDLKMSSSFSSKPYSVFYSCDMSDAYTNCSLQDLISAVKFLFSVVDRDKDSVWKEDLAIKLATFVFTNGYIEAAGDVWLAGDMLPMGCVASGEALDSIGLAGEVSALVDMSDCGMEGEAVLQQNNRLTVDTYCRYRDDIRIVDSKNDLQAIVRNMNVIASKLFPSNVKISFDLSVFYGSFLDTVFFRNVSTNSFTTCVRLNLSSSSSSVNASSCIPTGHKIAGFLSNGIRGYRLCSEPSLYCSYLWMLEEEMRSAGFDRKDHRGCWQQAKCYH